MIDIKEHRFTLIQILKDIYSDKEIGPALGFKGGTALYLFYNLPRFSVDLDFNLLYDEQKDLVFQKLRTILEKYGRLKEAREKRFTLFFLLSYSREATNIKVEISKRRFPDNYEIKSYLGIPMLVMKKEDIVAHKLVAFLERKNIANRDMFDLWFFLKNNWPVNKELVEIRTKEKFNNFLENCIEAVERVNKRYIKKDLKQELLFLMRYYLKD